MMRALGGLARRITEQTSDLVFLDLAGRLAKTLGMLADRDGRLEGDTLVLALPLTQTELAEMVGGSRQSVNHILKTFETRGFLELGAGRSRSWTSRRSGVVARPEPLRLSASRARTARLVELDLTVRDDTTKQLRPTFV